jgi:uncharacterized protein involved in type VI secretion and phage assembly
MDLFSLGASAGLDLKLGLGSPGSAGGRAHFELRIGPFVHNELAVLSFKGSEKLNQPFIYDVIFASTVSSLELQAAIFGVPASLSLQTADGYEPRVIQGLAVAFEAIGAGHHDLGSGARTFRTRIVPRLWLLHHRKSCRVFQDKSAVEVACSVLREAGIKPDVRLRREDYAPLPFLYQRDETDFEFVSRVLASAGIFYYFRHATGLVDGLLGGAGQVAAIAGTIGGLAGAGSAALGAGASVGVGGLGAGASAVGGLGGLAGAAGGGGDFMSDASAVVGDVGAALGMVSTMVLADQTRSTEALNATSLAGDLVGLAGGIVSSGLGAVASMATSAIGGALGGAVGGAIDVTADLVGELAEGGDAIAYDADGDAATANERISAFRLRKEVRPRSARVRDWDLGESVAARAQATAAAAKLALDLGLSAGLNLITGKASLAAGITGDLSLDAIPIAAKDLTVLEYQRDASAPQSTGNRATRALGQLRSDWMTARGESDSRRLAPGYRFRLEKHPIDALNSEYLVTATECDGYNPDFLPPRKRASYRTRFRCVPRAVDPKPKKPAPRKPLRLEPAEVIGPARGDIHTDAIGRIQVRFRWAEARNVLDSDPTAGTCWVHWLERWGGDGYGTMTLPRVGSEVLVDFPSDGGAPPVAIGQVYSRSNMPPFSLPRDAAHVGFKTVTVPDGAPANELVCDDMSSLVSMTMRTTGRFALEVSEAASTNIGGDSHLEVAGNAARLVRGDATESFRGQFTRDVHGGESLSTFGFRNETVVGSWTSTATGLRRDICGASRQCSVRGDSTTTVQGDMAHSVTGDMTATIGLADGDAAAELTVHGNVSVTATDTIFIEAEKKLVLKCGDTRVELTPEALRAFATAIGLSATKEVVARTSGSAARIDEKLVLISDNIEAHGKGASLVLDDVAHLSGSKVKLGNGSGASDKGSTDAVDPKTRKLTAKLLDEEGKPLANKTFHLLGGGERVVGRTTAEGVFEARVPKETTAAHLRLALTEDPDGPAIVYAFKIATFDGADDRKGQVSRLRNLGYLRDEHASDDAFRGAVMRFQTDRRKDGLSVTGTLDAKTSAALISAHGH